MLAFQVESWIWYGLVLFISFSRFVSRRMALGSFARFQADEYVMCAILCLYTVLIATINVVEDTSSNLLPPGYDIQNMTQADIDERTLGSKLVLVVENCQILVVWGTKACLLIMYLRFTTLKKENWAIKAVAAYVVFSFIVMEVLYLGYWCRPFHNYWAVPTPDPQCDAAINHLITNAVFNISSDVLMLALGIPMFARIRLPLSKKIPLVGIFSLGIFVILAAVLNKYFSFTDPFGDDWVFWYVRESATAIIVANLPFVWLLYRRMFGIRSTTNATGSRSRGGGALISLHSVPDSKMPSRLQPPRSRKMSDDSQIALGHGKSYVCEVTTAEVEEDLDRDSSFDDKMVECAAPATPPRLAQSGRARDINVTTEFSSTSMEAAVLYSQKFVGSFA